MCRIVVVIGCVNLANRPDVVFINDGHVVKTAATAIAAKFVGLPGKIMAGGVHGGQAALQGGGVVAVLPGKKAVGVGRGGLQEAVIDHRVGALQTTVKNGLAVALHNIIRAAFYAVHMQADPGFGHAGVGGHAQALVGKGVGAGKKTKDK